MELLYLVRRGNHNEPLRYSLRSIAAHWPEASVTVAGYTPHWVQGVRSIDVPQRNRHHSNVLRILRETASHSWGIGTGEFILMNDDFYLLRPVDGLNDPKRWGLGYGLTFEELVLKPGWRTGYYRECLRNTEKFLKSEGVENPVSYDRLHVPMKVSLPGLWYVLSQVQGPILHRSAYGNIAEGVERFPEIDVKIRHFQQMPISDKWLSTNNLSWRGLAGQYVRSKFPDKCKYEK